MELPHLAASPILCLLTCWSKAWCPYIPPWFWDVGSRGEGEPKFQDSCPALRGWGGTRVKGWGASSACTGLEL